MKFLPMCCSLPFMVLLEKAFTLSGSIIEYKSKKQKNLNATQSSSVHVFIGRMFSQVFSWPSSVQIEHFYWCPFMISMCLLQLFP